MTLKTSVFAPLVTVSVPAVPPPFSTQFSRGAGTKRHSRQIEEVAIGEAIDLATDYVGSVGDLQNATPVPEKFIGEEIEPPVPTETVP